jgi:predicted Zn-dependent protease
MSMRLAAFAAMVLFTISACQKDTSDFANGGNFITYRHDLNVGASAKDLLSSVKYKSLVVEIQYLSDDYKPDNQVTDHFKAMLQQRLNKPDGISIVTKQIKPSTISFGLDQIKSVEEASRTVFTAGNQLSVYILYLNGYYATDSLVLGAAYRNTSIVVFGKSILDFSTGDSIKKDVFDATVLEHEFGHLMGLVDEGTPLLSDHKDPVNGNHCTNTDCLMYFAMMDGSHDSQYSGLASVPVLDSACVADLRGNGGK